MKTLSKTLSKTLLVTLFLLFTTVSLYSQNTSDVKNSSQNDFQYEKLPIEEQSNVVVNNVDQVFETLKNNRSNLKTGVIKDFAYINNTKDTLYLQKDNDISYYIVEIWKTDNTIKGDIPYIVLCNVSEVIKQRK